MVWGIMKLDLRKVLVGYVPFVAVLLAYLLLRPRPLESMDVIAMAAGLMQGCYLGWRIFSDPAATQSFVFSRPFSRRRIFWQRWSLGIVLQMVTLLLVFALVATGVRGYVHQDSPYYPMVQWYEVSVLWPIGLVSLIAYEIQMFLMLRGWILLGASASRRRTMAGWASAGFIGLTLLLGVFFPRGVGASGFLMPASLQMGIGIYTIILAGLATAASAKCYRHMEIEA
ncbi:MAG: hypothetical protein ACYST6_02985 [Planctomycetota bacterium]